MLNYSGTEITDVTVKENYIELVVYEGKVVELKHITEDMDFCRSISPSQQLGLLLEAKQHSNITIEAKKYGNKNLDWAKAVALVSPSLYHKILFNYTIRILAKSDIKAFSDKSKAENWLNRKMKS